MLTSNESNSAVNPSERPSRMDCRVKPGNDDIKIRSRGAFCVRVLPSVPTIEWQRRDAPSHVFLLSFIARGLRLRSAHPTKLPDKNREAERRKAHCPTNVRVKRGVRAVYLRAHLSALTLAALATGFYPDGSAPEPGFPRRRLTGVLPASPTEKMPRLSTLRADRSLCRSTGDPKPPGSGLAKKSARGHRASPSLFRHAVRNGALHKARFCTVTEIGTQCQGKSDGAGG